MWKAVRVRCSRNSRTDRLCVRVSCSSIAAAVKCTSPNTSIIEIDVNSELCFQDKTSEMWK